MDENFNDNKVKSKDYGGVKIKVSKTKLIGGNLSL
jgi:hypothetical protein